MVYPYLEDLNDEETGMVNFTSDFVPITFDYIDNRLYCYNVNGWDYETNPDAVPYYGANWYTNHYGIHCS